MANTKVVVCLAFFTALTCYMTAQPDYAPMSASLCVRKASHGMGASMVPARPDFTPERSVLRIPAKSGPAKPQRAFTYIRLRLRKAP
jgi:hypothetical protein